MFNNLKTKFIIFFIMILSLNNSIIFCTSNSTYVKNMKYFLSNWSFNYVSSELRNGYYTGYIKNKMPNGNGTFYANIKIGQTIFNWYYKGSWKNGRPNGYGTVYIGDGFRYSGQWKNGLMDGKCELVPGGGYSLELKIVGTYKINKFIGNATYYLSNGDKFIGYEKTSNLLQGTYIYKNGDKFIGCVNSDYLKEGKGTYIYKNGKKLSGIWKDGKYASDMGFNKYKGKWLCSKNATTSAMVMKNGGLLLDIKEVTGNFIKGNIMTIGAAPGNRVASTDFQGTIINNKLNFSFNDDGWYDKGKLSITFKKDKISVNISTILSKNNSSGWTLGNGQFEFVKEK